MKLPFADRREAGRMLAAELASLRGEDPLVLGLPRGGVPVAFEVAKVLDAPLDIVVVRKIGMPGHEEYGIGAVVVTNEPHLVMNEQLVAQLRPDPALVEREIERQIAEARRRLALYRGDRAPPAVAGRTVILVDDGLATGGTARAALRAVRSDGPAMLVLAVPVGAPDSVASLEGECDLVVCPFRPPFFGAVSVYYRDFTQTADSEVLELLA